MWGRLCSWRWIQDVPRGAIVYREGVVTGGPQIIGTPYHGGALSLEYGFQNLQVLVDGGIPRLPNNPSPMVNNVVHNSCPRTMQGGSIPMNMNYTLAWVFSDFMELQTITHHLDCTILREKRQSLG